MDLELSEYLGVAGDLLEEMRRFSRHLLCLLGGKEPPQSEGPVKHLDDPDPLGVLKVQENVLAQDQAEPVSDWVESKEIMLLELDSVSQELAHPESASLFVRLEILFQQLFGHPFDLLLLIETIADDVTKEAAIVEVRCMNPEVLEAEPTHAFGKQHGQGIGFLSHGAPRIPDTHVAASACVGDHMFDGMFQRLQVSEKIGECHTAQLHFAVDF
jgi:hypothetical protein